MLTAEQGDVLLRLARHVLETQFGRQGTEPEGLDDPALRQRKGVFVTLMKQGKLRGCSGSLKGTQPILDEVRQNTINAALHDHRFPPLTAEELPDVRIELAILTTPKTLRYADSDDLVRTLRPMMDGVVLKLPHGLGATFLPQVWHKLPEPEIFLEQLCRKAGLSGSAWRSGELIVQTYQVVRFEEQEPSA